MKYKVRTLNVLDIRRMAKILREARLSKEEFVSIVGDVFAAARQLSKDKTDGDNISAFMKALIPAIDGLLMLLADSDSFWAFFASLIGVEHDKLEEVSLLEVKAAVAELMASEQVTGFFTSITAAGQKKTTTG